MRRSVADVVALLNSLPPERVEEVYDFALFLGDVVSADFPGVTGTKRRPAVVVSSAVCHQHRPDAVLGLLTTRLASATQPSDYVLQDWAAAGLRRPSAFRSFLFTLPVAGLSRIGQLTSRDWDEVQARLRVALSTM